MARPSLLPALIAAALVSPALVSPTWAQVADPPNPAPPETGQAQLPGPASSAAIPPPGAGAAEAGTAEAPAVSGVTVTPNTGKVDPKLQCKDDACVKAVVQTLKTRYPKVYRGLMQWCMLNETGRMALQTKGWFDQTQVFDPKDVEKTVCDDRFAKK